MFKVAAFGSVVQIFSVRKQLSAVFTRFKLSSDFDLFTYAAPELLQGHLLVQAEYSLAEGQIIRAAGCALSVDDALRALAGELRERTFFWTYQPTTVRCARYSDLLKSDEHVLDVSRFIGAPVHQETWPHPAFNPSQLYPWVEGTTGNGPKTYIPAGLVSVAEQFSSSRFVEMTSSGLAVGEGTEDAAKRAYAELVERDTLMRCWMGSCGLIELRSGPDAPGWRTTVLGAPTDAGWFALVVTRRDDVSPIGAIGAAVRLDPNDAIAHAHAEAIMMRFGASITRGDQSAASVIADGNEVKFRTRTARYCSKAGVDALDAFVNTVITKEHAKGDSSFGDCAVIVLSVDYPTAIRVLDPSCYTAESVPESARVPVGIGIPQPDWHLAHPHPLG